MARPRSSVVCNKPITQSQNRKIWASARSLSLDSDALHGLAYAICAKDSLKELNVDEAARLIDELERREKGHGQPDSRYVISPKGRPVALATKGQLWKIDRLVEELEWDDNPKRLEGFCKKYSKVDKPQWLTKSQAWRLIEGLKKILEKNSEDK